MSQNKQTRRELLEIEVRLNEIERARPYLNSDFYWDRKNMLLERKEVIQKKLDNKELAPDIQYIIAEVAEDGTKLVELNNPIVSPGDNLETNEELK